MGMTSLADWGLYIAGVASILIWLLKWIGDWHKRLQARRNSGGEDLLTRALWRFAPRRRGDRTKHAIAWATLACTGVLLAGLALGTLWLVLWPPLPPPTIVLPKVVHLVVVE